MQARPIILLATLSLALLSAFPSAGQVRSVTPATQGARQAAPAGSVTFGLPNPSGLSSPTAAGLAPPTAPSLTPPDTPNLSSPGTPPGSPVVDAGIAQLPTPSGGAGYGALARTNVLGASAAARGPLTAVEVARAFLDADTNRDGELSRAEAERAGLSASFDDLDRNRDGVLSRSEFEDAFR